MNNFLEKIKAFGRESYYYLSSRVFWFNFGKMLAAIAIAVFMIFWLMKCFTRHGKSVKVGNYIEKTMRDAERKADDDGGFDLVVTDSVYREDFPPDMILEQNPLPNSFVKPGRTIYVKITTTRGSLMRLPDIAGNDEINGYIENLKMLNIKSGRVDTLLDPDLGDGTIMKILIKGQDVVAQLAQGVMIPQGTVVDFVISKRERKPEVPNFMAGGRYLTLEEYRFTIESLELKIGEVVKDATVNDENSAYVIKVSPPPRIDVKKGDSVVVFITQKNPAQIRTDNFDE